MEYRRRSRLEVIANSIISTVIGALILGFFAVLWTTSNSIQVGLQEACDNLERTDQKIDASSEVFSEEVAKLRTGIRRLETMIFAIHEAVPDVPENEVFGSVQRSPEEREEDPSALQIQRDLKVDIYERSAEKR
jgi:hypothetical protein